MSKVCSKCGRRKPLEDFYRARTRDGRRADCKQCAERLRRMRSGVRERGPRPESGLRRCSVCGQIKALAEFYPDKRYGWESRCKACAKERRRRQYAADPERFRAATREWYALNRQQRREVSKVDAERFWAFVRRGGVDECWPWQGSMVPSGYGQFSVGAHGYRAHRMAYELTVGPLEPGAALAHSCGNRACCNPGHIRFGYDGKGVDPEARFWRNVEQTGTCWLWLGSADAGGYGHIKVDGRQLGVGPFAYRLLVGEVPAGQVVHRRCGQPRCVNPEHLELVGASEIQGLVERDLPTHCSRGHAYGEDPPRRSDGSRRCLACERIFASGRRAKIREAWVEDVDPLVVLELHDGTCGICGGDVDPLDFDVDHIEPLAREGEHSYANAQPAHPLCNRRKNSKLQDELDLQLFIGEGAAAGVEGT